MSQHNNIFLVSREGGQTNYKRLAFDAHKTPEFEPDKKKSWIEYGTKKTVGREWQNNYPEYLVYLYNSSSTHNSILNKKTSYIVGQGWSAVGKTTEQEARLDRFIKHPNPEENLKTLTWKTSLDKKLYGGYSVQVILDSNKNIAEVWHIDFGNLRRDKEDRDKFYFTSDWSVRMPDKNEDFEELYSFPFDRDEVVEGRKYIIYLTEYRPNSKEYPLPDYIASNPYIEADYEIGNFVLNNTKNGFTAGYLANFYNGEPDEEGKAYIDQQFDNMFTGSDQAGKVVKSFSPSRDNGVELTPLAANGQDDRYLNLEKTITNKIFVGHQVPPAAFPSVSEVTGLGNNSDEKRVAIESYQADYVDKEQEKQEDLFNAIVEFNGLPGTLEILKVQPVQDAFSEQTLLQILTTDELREKAGFEPLERTEMAHRTRFSKEDDQRLLGFFNQDEFGIPEDKLEVISEREISYLDMEDAFRQEKEFKFVSLGNTAILNLLKAGLPIQTIERVLNLSPEDLTSKLDELRSEGLINDNNEVTNTGQEEEVTEDELFIVYKYKTRSDAPALKTHSRDFCREMLTISNFKSFTKEDIQQISLLEGRDVFKYRGGWYNNPNTGRNTPYCRHIWQQRLVRLKD